ncbi:hypothetical protein [Thermus altitudinis]|uniref:hypothetical protein n=1 Tax=Thermus altitudinis TaxID=2908145 RepID=UPI001FAB0DB1|nr:hypothetical protein [Thermus altitudinis]
MKRIYLSPPHLSGLEETLLKEALDSGWIAPLGLQVAIIVIVGGWLKKLERRLPA